MIQQPLPPTLNIEEILRESEKAFQRFTAFCKEIPADTFFREPAGHWSIAQNLQHLVICTKTATAAYALPRFLVRLFGGKPNRPSAPIPNW
ncbi:DinB family protein [Paraflavitalea speifideaquila]|uniref:DinB family protein n=1 Tax=Paraflavitalea speifideaquila TaxID=3076558 RepID=UPI003312F9FB